MNSVWTLTELPGPHSSFEGILCTKASRPLNASTGTVLGGLLMAILAEQTLSDVAGEASCSIVCCLVGIEKSPCP